MFVTEYVCIYNNYLFYYEAALCFLARPRGFWSILSIIFSIIVIPNLSTHVDAPYHMDLVCLSYDLFNKVRYRQVHDYDDST